MLVNQGTRGMMWGVVCISDGRAGGTSLVCCRAREGEGERKRKEKEEEEIESRETKEEVQ